jgi:hypothetical protein
MWEDMAAAQAIIGDRPYELCALNLSGLFLPRVDHWFVTCVEKAPVLSKAREIGLESNGGYMQMHCPGPEFLESVCPRQRFWPVKTKGTIAMFAVRVLSSMDFDRIILAGVPLLDKSGHFYSAPWERSEGLSENLKVWEEHAPSLRHRVRSMSGNTLGILGRPDRDWLDGR